MSSVEFDTLARAAVLFRDQSRCVRCGLYLRDHPHVHHRKLRSQGGRGNVANGVTLCFKCHEWAHRNPAMAQGDGLIVASWDSELSMPVTTWYGRVRLDDDGQAYPATPGGLPSS
jgi:HNH endonuclease